MRLLININAFENLKLIMHAIAIKLLPWATDIVTNEMYRASLFISMNKLARAAIKREEDT